MQMLSAQLVQGEGVCSEGYRLVGSYLRESYAYTLLWVVSHLYFTIIYLDALLFSSEELSHLFRIVQVIDL